MILLLLFIQWKEVSFSHDDLHYECVKRGIPRLILSLMGADIEINLSLTPIGVDIEISLSLSAIADQKQIN